MVNSMFDILKNIVVEYGQAVGNRVLNQWSSVMFRNLDENQWSSVMFRNLDDRIDGLLNVQANAPLRADLLIEGKCLTGYPNDDKVEFFSHSSVVYGKRGEEQVLRLCPQTLVGKGLRILCWGADITKVLVANRVQSYGFGPFQGRMARTIDSIHAGVQLTIVLKFPS